MKYWNVSIKKVKTKIQKVVFQNERIFTNTTGIEKPTGINIRMFEISWIIILFAPILQELLTQLNGIKFKRCCGELKIIPLCNPTKIVANKMIKTLPANNKKLNCRIKKILFLKTKKIGKYKIISAASIIRPKKIYPIIVSILI
jgi:hypothetical protein